MPTADLSRSYRRGLRRCAALASAATLTAMTATLATSSPPAQAALSHHGGATTPDTTLSISRLYAVSADSASDAWAVGDPPSASGSGPLTLRWNGTAWKAVKSLAPSGALATGLSAVSAVSGTDAWATGSYENSSAAIEPLTMHWNGTAWKAVKTPVPSGATSPNLFGVSTVSATDAWAVGDYTNSSGVQESLILRWNGTVWKQVKSPVPSGATFPTLRAVSAVSATDAWAAGDCANCGNQPLILHWNGTAWKTVPSPAPSGSQDTAVNGVSAVSASDAWVAGWYENSSGANVPLTMHWTGTTWKQVASPAPSGATGTYPQGVSADSATDAWAAGYYTNSSGVFEPLTMHWTGTTWKQVASHAPSGAGNTYLFGVSAVSATDAWAAGAYYTSSGSVETLIMQWNGTAWKKVTSPNGT
jgi:hypothetical protein